MAKRIDITPTWSDMLPLMLTLAENGRMHDEVREEFYRMAALADKAVTDSYMLEQRIGLLCHAVRTLTHGVKDSLDFPYALERPVNDVIADISAVVQGMKGDEK